MGFSRGEIHGRDSGRSGSRLDILSAGTGRAKTALVGVRHDTGNGHFTRSDRNYISYELPGIFCEKITVVMAGVLVFGCAMIFQKDLLYFDSYIPKQEDIASVNLERML